MKIVDYIFFRISDYYKKKGNSAAIVFASNAISVLQCFLILDVLVIARIFYEYPIPSNFSKYWALPLIMVVGTFNWYRYERKPRYQEFRKLWKDEAALEKKRNGRAIVIFMSVTLITPVLYGFFKHNLALF